MGTSVEWAGPLAALLAGLITSLHCAGMCGPLACAICPMGGRKGWTSTAAYHGGRLFSYTLAGVVAGLVGRRFSDALTGGATAAATWLFILFFLAVVVGLDKHLRLPVPLGSFAWLKGASRACGGAPRAGILGGLTPLLPCAPLYVAVAAAAVSGSPWAGGMIMAAFAFGTMPLLVLIQLQWARVQGRWSPQTLDYLRRGFALVSVTVLLLRGTFTGGTGCPMCH